MVSELRGRSVMSACDGCARYCARRKFRRKAASARVRRNKVVPRKLYALVLVRHSRQGGSVFRSERQKKGRIVFMSEHKTFYITTPIYYPSDKLHIGHSYTTDRKSVV